MPGSDHHSVDDLEPIELTVMVCTYNGAAGLPATLDALAAQTAARRTDVVVVDDGSDDGTGDLAAARGVRVVRHPNNLGVAAARQSALVHARTELVAYTDDDCVPDPTWAAELLEAARRHPEAVAVGGATLPLEAAGLVQRYLSLHNPLAPLERSLLDSNGFGYRLRAYLRRQTGATTEHLGERPVASLAGANMALRRTAAMALGGFDARFRFGGEEEDLFRRVVLQGHDVIYAPAAVVRHDFDGTLRDTLRRSRAYGRGNARMFLKHRGLLPTLYPAPALVLASLAAAVVAPIMVLVAAVLPQVLYLRWPKEAIRARDPQLLVFAYLQLLQETASNIGWVQGWVGERSLFAVPPSTQQDTA